MAGGEGGGGEGGKTNCSRYIEQIVFQTPYNQLNMIGTSTDHRSDQFTTIFVLH